MEKEILVVTATIVAFIVMVLGTGCTSYHRMFEDSANGYVMLAGDAQGIQAYNDGLVGHITEARNNPDQKSAYWQNREQETAVRAMRFKRVEKK